MVNHPNRAKYWTDKAPDSNGDKNYLVYRNPDGKCIGAIRDCLSRGDNFLASTTRKAKLVSRYYSTKAGAANWLLAQHKGR